MSLWVGGERLMKPKAQLKDRTVEWLAGHRGYGCTVHDMWKGATDLDAKASNAALWGQGNGKRHVDVRAAGTAGQSAGVTDEP